MLCFLVAEGEKLEKEMNDKGPGEACLIKCDVTKEAVSYTHLTLPTSDLV